jgi:hypothetical protein
MKSFLSTNIRIFLVTSTVLFLASIGYSSRAINYDEVIGFSGDISAYDVVNFNDFFTFEDMDVFKITEYGLVDNKDSEVIEFTGDIRVKFNIAIKDGLYAYLPQTTSLSFSAYLSNLDAFSIINTTYMGSSPTVNYGVSTSQYPSTTSDTSSGSIADNQISSSISYSDASLSTIDYLFFTFVYSFDFTSVSSSFKDDIYDKVDEGGLSLFFGINLGI